MTLTVTILVVTFLAVADIRQASGQCSGTTQAFTATSSYTVFTSTNYPFNYNNNMNCIWRMQATNATDAIRLEVTDASIEYHADCVYDYAEVYDGFNASSVSLGKFCGTNMPNYVSSGEYLTVVFVSDYSLSARGFKAQFKSGERSSLLDPEDESSELNAVAILGGSIGAVVLIIIIMAVVFTYIQAKKAKEIQRNPQLHNGMSTLRVEPFSYDYGPTECCGPPPPPSYGDIYSSPVSPPPMYSEVDPNPQQDIRLPGRTVDETPAYGASRRTSGQISNVSVIANNPANTRFIQPQLTSARLQTSGALQNPAFTTVQQQNTRQNNVNNRTPVSISTGVSNVGANRVGVLNVGANRAGVSNPGENGAGVSNAGVLAAMNLLGTNPQASTNYTVPGRNSSVPTRQTGRPRRSMPNAEAVSSNGTGTTSVTNAPPTSSRVMPRRNAAGVDGAGGTGNSTVQTTGPPNSELQRRTSDVSDLSLGRSMSVYSSGRSISMSSLSSNNSVTPIENA